MDFFNSECKFCLQVYLTLIFGSLVNAGFLWLYMDKLINALLMLIVVLVLFFILFKKYFGSKKYIKNIIISIILIALNGFTIFSFRIKIFLTFISLIAFNYFLIKFCECDIIHFDAPNIKELSNLEKSTDNKKNDDIKIPLLPGRELEDLQNKRILIIGCSGGVGKILAFKLINEGAKVILACRNKNKTSKMIDQIKKNKSNASFIHINLEDFSTILHFSKRLKEVLEEDNNSKLDFVLNTANSKSDKMLLTLDNIEVTLQANLLSNILLLCSIKIFLKNDALIINSTCSKYKNILNTNLEKYLNGENYNKESIDKINRYGNFAFTSTFHEFLSHIESKIKVICVDLENSEQLLHNLIVGRETSLSNWFYSIETKAILIDKIIERVDRDKFMKSLVGMFNKTNIDLKEDFSIFEGYISFILNNNNILAK